MGTDITKIEKIDKALVKCSLEEYLYTNHLTATEFSRTIGYHVQYFIAVKNGRLPLSKRFKHQVEQATQGTVKL